MSEKNKGVGIIIGRFQVPELHKSYKKLIQHVIDSHDRVVIFLCLSNAKSSQTNPLDFEARKQMLLSEFPKVEIRYIKDQKFDKDWSDELDRQIKFYVDGLNPILYGSDQNFRERYDGVYNTKTLESDSFVSGSEILGTIGRKAKSSKEFRQGVFYAVNDQYPKVYPTVDVAIFNESHSKLLLARKDYETAWRFVGGFVDPRDASLEAAVRREVSEETTLAITDPKYIKSCQVDDWRYRDERDVILTNFFWARKQFGRPEPRDDIAELKWFEVKDLTKVIITDGAHQEGEPFCDGVLPDGCLFRITIDLVPEHVHLMSALVAANIQR